MYMLHFTWSSNLWKLFVGNVIGDKWHGDKIGSEKLKWSDKYDIDPYWICINGTGAGEKYIMLNLLCESLQYM